MFSSFQSAKKEEINFQNREKSSIMNIDSFKGKRLLIVEDNKDNAYCLNIAFKPYEMKITNAGSGREALSMLNKEYYDIVLMDIQMPGISGYETIKKIRKLSKKTSVPIISVTAYAMPEDRQKSLDAGADEYIPKPINWDELIEKMMMFL